MRREGEGGGLNGSTVGERRVKGTTMGEWVKGSSIEERGKGIQHAWGGGGGGGGGSSMGSKMPLQF